MLKKFCILSLILLAPLIVQAETYWATTVVAYYGTNAVSNINNILGAPDNKVTDVGTADGATWNNYLTVSFGRTFYDMAGAPDVAVYLHDLDTVEDFNVYVSANNSTWYQIGAVASSINDVFPSGGFMYFDMAGSGISSAYYVKIVTNEVDQAYAGPDLDAIAIVVPEPNLLGFISLLILGIFLKKRK